LTRGTSNALDSNRPFRGQKRTLWEGGVHVPGIVRWPGHVPADVESQELVHNLNLFPTLPPAACVRTPQANPIDGINLLECWLGKTSSPSSTIFWEWDEGGNKQLAAMRDNLKLIITGGNQPELYDVIADPAERRDIHAEYPGKLKSMDDQLKAWYAT